MRTLNRAKRHRTFAVESLETRQVLSTFFVSSVGSDKNPGTAAQPYLTLQKAANAARAGDTVDVQPGNYAGFMLGWDTPKSGLPGMPITFNGEPGANITARNAKTQDGIDLEGSSWITIQGFNINKMGRTGIRTNHGDHVTIQNNVCNANGNWGIETDGDNYLLIQNNVTSNSMRQHGIYVGGSSVNPQVLNNVIFGNHECGLHMNGDVIYGGSGIITNAVVQGNIIYDNGAHGGGALNCDGVQNSLISNNLLFNNHHTGITLYNADSGGPSMNNTVSNNTIVMDTNTRNPGIEILNGSTGNTLSHNIVFEPCGKPQYAIALSVAADSLPGFVSDGNAFMGYLSNNGGGTYITLAKWQGLTGQDSHSVVSSINTIGFVNPTGYDFELIAGSIPNLGSQMLPTGAININNPVSLASILGTTAKGAAKPLAKVAS